MAKDPELDKLGKKLVDLFPKATGVRLFGRVLNTAPLSEKWNQCSKDQPLGLDGERILGNCGKLQRSILIKNASEDPLLKGVGKQNFESCLCVPVLDDARFPVGFLYLTSDQEEAFTTHGRFAVEKLAQKAAPLLGAPQSALEVEEVERSPDLFRGWLALAALLLTLVVGLVIAPSKTGPEQPNSGRISADSMSIAREVTRKFAQHLRVGEYGQAWELLHPDLQRNWPRETFVGDLSRWGELESNQNILLRRKLSGIRRHGELAVAVFLATESEKDPTSWDWELRLADEHWRIQKLQGGPVENP